MAYLNYVNAKDGTILFIENYKERDENPTERRLWPSEVAWQSMLLGAQQEKVDPLNLHLLGRHSIVNVSTKIAIW